MNAVYDLRCSPASYDVVAFILAAERRRLMCGDDEFETFHILPGEWEGFRRDKFWPQDISQRIKMRDHVVLPMIQMLPRVKDARVVKQRTPLHCMNPFGHNQSVYGLKIQVECMKMGIRPLRTLVPITKKENFVTITLRECEHWQGRNSQVDEWFLAAAKIVSMGFEVMIIRDERISRTSPSILQRSIGEDLNLRGTIYSGAVCNMFVSNGPAWFALALDVPVLMLKPVTEGLMSTCSSEYFERCGIPRGGQIPSSPAYQRLAWLDDSRENILSAFCDFMEHQK